MKPFTPAGKEKLSLTTGVTRLDEILGGVFIGDNVVWYDESGSLALVFWHRFVSSSLALEKPVIFISFDRTPKNLFERLGPMGKNPLITVLDCFTFGKGRGSDVFLQFLKQAPKDIRNRVMAVDNPADPNEVAEKLYALHGTLSGDVRLVFESLTGMQEIWGGEDRVMEFYSHSCPRLYDLMTIAYWVAEKGAHSHRLRARINQIAQVAIDLSIKRGTTSLSVIKAEGRVPALEQPHKYRTAGDDIFFSGEKEEPGQESLGARIKRLRVKKGFYQAELAKLVGVTPSTISQVESNTIYPSIPGLLKIAEVLSVEPGYFFFSAPESRKRVVFPQGQATDVQLENVPDQGVSARSLLPLDFGAKVEPTLIEMEAGAQIEGHFMAHKGQELGYVLEGRVRIGLDASFEEAEAGDLICLTTQIPSQWHNPGPETARILWLKLL